MITGKTIYIDRLSFAVVFRVLFTGLFTRVLRRRGPLAIYYLVRSPKTVRWAAVLRRVLGADCIELDYANIDITDDAGNSSYIKVVEADTLEITNRIIQRELSSHPLVSKVSQRFEKPRLIAYFHKQIAADLIPHLLKINVASWHHRTSGSNGGSEADLYLPCSEWSKNLREYSSGHGIKTICYWTPGIRGWIPGNLIRSVVVRLGRAVFRLRRKPSSSPKTTPKSKSNAPTGVIAVEFSGNGITLDPSKNSDLFWLPFTDVSPDRVLVYCTRSDEPLNRDKMDSLDESLFRYVAMNKAAASDGAPVWTPPSKFSKMAARQVRMVCWESFISAFRRPRLTGWLMQRMLSISVDYALWRSFFEVYGIRVLFTSQGSPRRRISSEQALADLGGISVSYQRSMLSSPTPWVGCSVDVHFSFSPMVSGLLKASGGCASQVVSTGYVGDRGFAGAKPRAEQLKATLREQGAGFIICFLDEGSNPDRKEGYRADDHAAEDYRFLFTKLLEDPSLGLILKPKKPSTLRQRLGSDSAALDAALATGRCFIYDEGTATNTALPCEAGLASDVSVGLLVGQTASLECRLAGTPSLILDREHIPSHPFYALGRGSVVFQSWDELWQVLSDYRSDPASVPEFGDWSSMLDSLEPFRDGRAAERIGTYVGWLASGLNDGTPREEVLKQARKKYVDLWGEDKVARLKDNGLQPQPNEESTGIS